jgi:mRNA-degrading endonuclease toxin of MazEF toxin-antitoxin module
MNTPVCRRGDLWWADLGKLPGTDDTSYQDLIGYEDPSSLQKGVRPVILLSPKKASNSPCWYVAAITTVKKGNYPFVQKVKVPGGSDSFIHYEQIKNLPVKKLQRRIGRVTLEEYLGIPLHMPIPLGLDLTNILHIMDVKIFSKEKWPGELIIGCQIHRIYTIDTLFFTSTEFIEHFGTKHAGTVYNSQGSLEKFLKTLEGLKFLCLKESKIEYEQL